MDFQCPQNLDDGELWLPSDFLSEELPPKERVMHRSSEPQIPSEFPYEWCSFGLPPDSSYNSPVESVGGSTETESDEEDDYMAGLANQIAHAMLDDDENSDRNQSSQWASEQKMFANDGASKSNTMARSPQSTLSAAGSWSTGSSKGPSQVSSPPTTPLTENTDAWDLLYAAAGEVVRLEMDGANPISTSQMHAQGFQGHVKRPNFSASQSPAFLNKDFQGKSCSFSGLSSKDRVNSFQMLQRSWSDKTREEDTKLLAHQYRQPKQNHVTAWGRQAKPMQVQHLQTRPGNKSAMGNRSIRSEYSSPPWPPVKQAGGTGMRAVFLGTNGSGRESGGTGVFLPRRAGCNSDLRRKPTCSTVLLPTRIVHALNLNVEDISSQPSTQCGLLHNYRDALTSAPGVPSTSNYVGRSVDYCSLPARNGFNEYQKKPCYPVSSQIQTASSEISLPQEWTY